MLLTWIICCCCLWPITSYIVAYYIPYIKRVFNHYIGGKFGFAIVQFGQCSIQCSYDFTSVGSNSIANNTVFKRKIILQLQHLHVRLISKQRSQCELTKAKPSPATFRTATEASSRWINLVMTFRQLLFWPFTEYLTVRLKDITVETSDSLLLQFEYIDVRTKVAFPNIPSETVHPWQEQQQQDQQSIGPVAALQLYMGAITLQMSCASKNNESKDSEFERVLVKMARETFLTIQLHFDKGESQRAPTLNIKIQLGKMNVNVNSCSLYYSRRATKFSSKHRNADLNSQARTERLPLMPSHLIRKVQHFPSLRFNISATSGIDIVYDYNNPCNSNSCSTTVVCNHRFITSIEEVQIDYEGDSNSRNKHSIRTTATTASLLLSANVISLVLATDKDGGSFSVYQSLVDFPGLTIGTDALVPFSTLGTVIVNTTCHMHHLTCYIPFTDTMFKYFVQSLLSKTQPVEVSNDNGTVLSNEGGEERTVKPSLTVIDIPVMIFAIVLYSPKVAFVVNDNAEFHAHQQRDSSSLIKVTNIAEIRADHFIVRLFGDYASKCSSNSSDSDFWFAQQEYIWLTRETAKSTLARMQQYQKEREKTRNAMFKVFANLVSSEERAPHRPQPQLEKTAETPAAAAAAANGEETIGANHVNGKVYRLTANIILNKFKMGKSSSSSTAREDSETENSRQLLRLKRASIKFTTSIPTSLCSFADITEERLISFLDRGAPVQIHVEASVDKPVVQNMLSPDKDSIIIDEANYWLKYALETATSVNPTTTKSTIIKSANGTEMNKRIHFSYWQLDITRPSVIIYCIDDKDSRTASIEHSNIDKAEYVNNSPQRPVYMRVSISMNKLKIIKNTRQRHTDAAPHSNTAPQFRSYAVGLSVYQSSYTNSISDAYVSNLDIEKKLCSKECQYPILMISQLDFHKELSAIAGHQQTEGSHLQPLTELNINGLAISYSISNHYVCLLFAQSLKALEGKFNPIKRDENASNDKIKKEERTRLKLNAYIDRVDIRIDLPFERKLHLKVEEIGYRNYTPNSTIDNVFRLHFQSILVLIESACHAAKWEQLINVGQTHISRSVNNCTALHSSGAIVKFSTIEASKISIAIPYQFHLSGIIESVITNIKAVKILHARLLKSNPYTYFGPNKNNTPVTMPTVQIRAGIFEIQFDDDPFESKLRQIFKAGLIEQQKRSAYQDALDRRIAFMLDKQSEIITSLTETEQAEEEEEEDEEVDTAFASALTTVSSSASSFVKKWRTQKQSKTARSIKSDQQSFCTAQQTFVAKDNIAIKDGIDSDTVHDCSFAIDSPINNGNLSRVSNLDDDSGSNIIIDSSVSEEDVFARIDAAQNKLYAAFSNRWIQTITEIKQREKTQLREEASEKQNSSANNAYGSFSHPATTTTAKSGHLPAIHTTILPRPCQPALAHFRAENVDLAIKQPMTFRSSEARTFIHSVGKGVPFETDFSILIPFHLSIKANTTWIKLRDYPLPFLYVPSPVSCSQNGSKTNHPTCVWNLEGDYVIADERGNSDGSRIIPVPLLKSAAATNPSQCSSEEQRKDVGYCLSVVRTASPLKFFSVVDYQIFTNGMSMICWSISYHPAVQDVIRVLGTLIPAAVDPSPRLSWWDKIRFMIHSKIKFDFTKGQGDLALVIKGTRSPYNIEGAGSGLIKIWGGNVLWRLGYQNEQNEFMQITSERYMFGVPNLRHQAYTVAASDTTSALKQNHNTHLLNSSPMRKVVLQLVQQIRMGVGLSYERLACDGSAIDGSCEKSCSQLSRTDRCRSQQFIPHYRVLYKSLKRVQQICNLATYDAFKGFRSDFIHLSFSFLQENENASMETGSGNSSMHLSPCFAEHFHQWRQLFGSPISIPVRQGKLFAANGGTNAKSFGNFLDTIKYRIFISPLSIGYMCSDLYVSVNPANDDTLFEKRFAGLKARLGSFSADLHQRKQVVSMQGPTLLSNTHTAAKPISQSPSEYKALSTTKMERVLHEAEVEIRNIEVFALRISKNDTSGYNNPSSAAGISWIDRDDFTSLDSAAQDTPKLCLLEAHPFAFSPLISVLKQIDDEQTLARKKYLRHTHSCIFGEGQAKDAHAYQKEVLTQEAYNLNLSIEECEADLETLNDTVRSPREEKHLVQEVYDLRAEIERLRFRRYVLEAYLAQLILKREYNVLESDERDNNILGYTSSQRTNADALGSDTLKHPFKTQCFVYQPQVIWNNTVRDIIRLCQKIRSTRTIQKYNLTTHCYRALEQLVHGVLNRKYNEKKARVLNSVYSHPLSTDPESLGSVNISTEDIAQTLLEKLMEEYEEKSMAYSEVEEQSKTYSRLKEDDEKSNADSNRSSFREREEADGLSDPEEHYMRLKDQQTMESNCLFTIFSPQLLLQANSCRNNSLLLVNEQILVKTFAIYNEKPLAYENDIDVAKVKDRMFANLDNAQLYIVRNTESDNVYRPLSQQGFGGHAWLKPEQLWYYKDLGSFEGFQRITETFSGMVQADRHNQLQVKNATDRNDPFDSCRNMTQVHFPQFKLTLSSAQAHTVYYILTNLLMSSANNDSNSSSAIDREEIFLDVQSSDLRDVLGQISVLQEETRLLRNKHQPSVFGVSSFNSINYTSFGLDKTELLQKMERLQVSIEAVKSHQMLGSASDLKGAINASSYMISVKDLLWRGVLETDNGHRSSLCEWALSNTKFTSTDARYGSRKYRLEVDTMQLQDTTENAVFRNVFGLYDDQRPEYTVCRRKKMLSATLVSSPPVGGISIIQHLELNLAPLRIQFSTAFGSMLKDYFFPILNDKEGEKLKNTEATSSSSVFVGAHITETENETARNNRTKNSNRLSKLVKLIKKSMAVRKPQVELDQLTRMKKRSSRNRVFLYVRIPSTKHFLSIRGPNHNTFYNLNGFHFKQPKLEYRNKIWSLAEMMDSIQRQFIYSILKQSPSLLKRKLLPDQLKWFASSSSSTVIPAEVIQVTLNRTGSDSRPEFSSDVGVQNIYVLDNSSGVYEPSLFNSDETISDAYMVSYHSSDDLKHTSASSSYIEDDEAKSFYSASSRDNNTQLFKKRSGFDLQQLPLRDNVLVEQSEQTVDDESFTKMKILFGEKYASERHRNSEPEQN